jgi:hypothetical protein
MEQRMKTYQIELKRTSYISFEIEADNVEAAEAAAWLELQTTARDVSDADWDLNHIEEVTC